MAKKGAVVIDVIAQIDNALEDLQKIKSDAENLDPTINLEMDFSSAEQGLENIKQKVQELNTDIATKGTGIGGFFDGLITKIGGKITGLGADFSMVFGLAKQHLTDIGMKLTSIMGIVGVVLAVAYVLVDAFKQVVGENQELNKELQWIGQVLNNLIMPLVNAIKSVVLTFLKGVIKVIKAILGWVRDIIRAVSGRDIFAGIEIKDDIVDGNLVSTIGGAMDGARGLQKETAKTRENTKGINKDTGGISKNLKDAKKQLAGFDEMNVLSDNKSSAGGGGVNLGNLGGVGGGDIQPTIEKTKELGTETKTASSIIKESSGDILDTYNSWKIDIIKTKQAGKELNDTQKLHIGTMERQITELLGKNKLSKEEKQLLKGLTSQYGDLYREGALNAEQMQIYKILNDKNITSDKERALRIEELRKKYKAKEKAEKDGISVQEAYNEANYTGKVYMDENGKTLEDVAEKYGLNKDQVDKLKDALDIYNDKSISVREKSYEFSDALNDVGNEAGLTMGEIKMLSGEIKNMKGKEVEVKVNKPAGSVLTEIGKTIANKIGTKKTVDVNVEIPSNNALKKLGSAIKNGVQAGIGVAQLALSTQGGKSKNRKGAIIKYASGGIINQPGRGVPLAVGGEAGREGVIPLTDSQQMALLGEAIGRYITINANITNTMNGRVLSRELQKIQNEEAFGSNRW